MTTIHKAYLIVLLFVAAQSAAQSIEPIWLSPTNVTWQLPQEFPERGVWSNISVGAGGRNSIPLVLMDSKKTLWIMFGNSDSSELTTVWNYDPMTDLYRWVAGPGDLTTQLRNPGQLGVPSETNAPGPVYYTIATIDHNDMIWFFTTQYCCELWTFNTTSYLFTRVLAGTPAQGKLETACFVTDSSNNMWVLSGITQSPATSTNRVWFLNTTSMQWTFVSGNATAVKTVYGDNPLYGGRQEPGCDIDENDRVWMFGGTGFSSGFSAVYSDMWSFDTRTRQWQLERGSNTTTVNNGQSVVSADFHPDNNPSARQCASVVDRKDGTLVVAGAETNEVWLFHKTLKQWKLVYSTNSTGNYSNYRAPGSVMTPRQLQGTAKGLNVNGDLFMLGGYHYNDLWLIPFDQCSNNATYHCGSNAHCVDEMIGYSCACDGGYTGDGLDCTAIPQSPPVSPISVPQSVEPTASAPKSKSGVSSASSFVASAILTLIAIPFVL